MTQLVHGPWITVSRALWVSSLLLRVGIAGAALAAWAAVSGAIAQTGLPLAVAATVAGAAIAFYSLRKAWRLLENAGEASPGQKPRRAAQRPASSLAALTR